MHKLEMDYIIQGVTKLHNAASCKMRQKKRDNRHLLADSLYGIIQMLWMQQWMTEGYKSETYLCWCVLFELRSSADRLKQ